MQPWKPANAGLGFFRRDPEPYDFDDCGFDPSDKPAPPQKPTGEPRFIREAPYMPGYYEWTPSSDSDSKYFRYQNVPTDEFPAKGSEEDNISAFSSLIEDGVLSSELAKYLQSYYKSRYNIIFAGGSIETRTDLMEALLESVPARNIIQLEEYLKKDEENSIEPLSFAKWKKVDDRLQSRNDVLLFNGVVLDSHDQQAMMQHAIHHIFIAGVDSVKTKCLRRFRFNRERKERSEIPYFNSITVMLGKEKIQGKGKMDAVKVVVRYQDYYNSASDLEEISWYRENGLLVRKPSRVVY